MERRRGAAGELHARSAAEVAGPVLSPAVLFLEADAPAVVLGSSQPESDVDARRAAAAGWAVARRRSGGGAVLVGQGRCLWVDVVIGTTHRRWDDDVGRAAWWVGEAWVAALGALGVPGAEAWRGGFRRSRWSRLVCFAGTGPGEVTVGGRKVVGLSQRRTRHGALFQCAALLDADHRPLLDVLALSPRERGEAAADLDRSTFALAPGAAGALEQALLDTLSRPEVAFGNHSGMN